MIRLLTPVPLFLFAGPVLAHEGHGEPGLIHGFSGEHGLALLAAILVMAITAGLCRPLHRICVRLVARYRTRR